MTNFKRWQFYLQDFESPQLFVDWSFYYMIGAALERRVWWGDHPMQVFPNPFVIFIGPPGSGKSMPGDVVKDCFSSIDEVDKKTGYTKQVIKRGPNSITLARLTEWLHENYTTISVPLRSDQSPTEKPDVYTYSSIAFIASGEIGNLFKKDDKDLIRFFNEGWDCKDFTKETKGCGHDNIRNMCVSLLGCGTPNWMRDAVNSSLLNEGLSARAIFVSAGLEDRRKLTTYYKFSDEQKREYQIIKEHIKFLSGIIGEVDLPKSTIDWFTDWYERRNVRINSDRKLDDYYGRKKVHLMKMAMILHFADSQDMTIRVEDMERALDLLNITELNMSRALSGVGTNKIAKLAAMIEIAMRSKKEEYEDQIVCEFFDDGSEIDIKLAVDFLCNTNKLVRTVVKPYKLKYKQREETAKVIIPSSNVVSNPNEVVEVKQTNKVKRLTVIEL